MTKPATFTQAALQRAIRAARNAGLHIVEIKSDGSLVVSEQPIAIASTNPDAHNSEDKWGLVEA